MVLLKKIQSSYLTKNPYKPNYALRPIKKSGSGFFFAGARPIDPLSLALNLSNYCVFGAGAPRNSSWRRKICKSSCKFALVDDVFGLAAVGGGAARGRGCGAYFSPLLRFCSPDNSCRSRCTFLCNCSFSTKFASLTLLLRIREPHSAFVRKNQSF